MKKVVCCVILLCLVGCKDKLKMPDFYNKDINEVLKFTQSHDLKIEIKEAFSTDIKKDYVMSQNIKAKEKLNEDSTIVVTKSLGINYKEYKVDESGNVPIMMYHSIANLKDENTDYVGGNVDSEGYTRTAESFRRDLDFYYHEGYRIVRLKDYTNGNIDVPLGKSPLILTFDDGYADNIKVEGIDENGEIIIDKNSAVGILEEYKKKYPDFHITATFFVSDGLFQQQEYNEQILQFLVEHGYDIGNHTLTHDDLESLDSTKVQKEVGLMYQKLDTILKGKYVPIVALPFGSPYSMDDSVFPYILSGNYDGFKYETDATLRVGWEAEYSPFHKNFDKRYLKRIRAYDHNGSDFDIEMNFEMLKQNRYISDGDIETVVIPSDKKDDVNINNKKLIIY